MIEWNEKLLIGIEVIDQEHKEIIEEFNKLYQQMRQGKGHDYYRDMIDYLKNYVEKHLSHEEAYQDEIMYPDYEQHKALHDAFRNKVHELSQKNLDSVSDKELIELNLFIKNWLLHHIMKVDIALGDFSRRLNGDF